VTDVPLPAVDSGSGVPRHVAIVMDGNGRWAKKRFLPRVAGHKQGIEALRRTVKACLDAGIGVLSVFAFSSENWSRPQEEVSGLMELMALALTREVSGLHQQGVQIHFPGDTSSLSKRVVEGQNRAVELTAANTALVLNVCFNYGGRWDICQAAARVQSDGLPMTEGALSERLALAHVPDPDLFIRTGGEMRVSNFLIWQMAYAEFYFSSALWPDFGAAELDLALTAYRQRERRFGLTSEQVGVSAGTQPKAGG
jgi:undecaprenyl diphosphate synthase